MLYRIFNCVNDYLSNSLTILPFLYNFLRILVPISHNYLYTQLLHIQYTIGTKSETPICLRFYSSSSICIQRALNFQGALTYVFYGNAPPMRYLVGIRPRAEASNLRFARRGGRRGKTVSVTRCVFSVSASDVTTAASVILRLRVIRYHA
jgi:hypothetical protein